MAILLKFYLSWEAEYNIRT